MKPEFARTRLETIRYAEVYHEWVYVSTRVGFGGWVQMRGNRSCIVTDLSGFQTPTSPLCSAGLAGT